MEQLSFLSELTPKGMEAPPLSVWDKMAAGMQDYDLAEERAKIENQRKKTM